VNRDTSHNKTPRFSIVTVVYNAVNEILQTIQSVSQLQYHNIEYIIIDGGSSDGTLTYIKNHIEDIDTWVTEPDNGIYDAMNKGIILATGDFIIFMNAGDIFFSNDIINKVVNYADLTADILYGDSWTIGSRHNDGLHKAKNIDNIIYGMVCSHQSMFFRTTLLKHRHFSLDYGTAGDFELICFMHSREYIFHRLNGITISYYHGRGVSDTQRLQSLINCVHALRDLKLITVRLYIYYFSAAIKEMFISLYDRITFKV
jgi:glycosyltransferase involved in cell wall biosynthesis